MPPARAPSPSCRSERSRPTGRTCRWRPTSSSPRRWRAPAPRDWPPGAASPGAPSPDLHFGGLRAGLRRNALAPSRDRRGDGGGHRRQLSAARVHGARHRQRASRPRPPRVDRGRREPDPPRPAPRAWRSPTSSSSRGRSGSATSSRAAPATPGSSRLRSCWPSGPTWCAKPRWRRCRRIRRRSPARSARARWSFEEAGGARAYFGYPAQATAEEGRATIEVLGAILDEAVQAELA